MSECSVIPPCAMGDLLWHYRCQAEAEVPHDPCLLCRHCLCSWPGKKMSDVHPLWRPQLGAEKGGPWILGERENWRDSASIHQAPRRGKAFFTPSFWQHSIFWQGCGNSPGVLHHWDLAKKCWKERSFTRHPSTGYRHNSIVGKVLRCQWVTGAESHQKGDTSLSPPSPVSEGVAGPASGIFHVNLAELVVPRISFP